LTLTNDDVSKRITIERTSVCPFACEKQRTELLALQVHVRARPRSWWTGEWRGAPSPVTLYSRLVLRSACGQPGRLQSHVAIDGGVERSPLYARNTSYPITPRDDISRRICHFTDVQPDSTNEKCAQPRGEGERHSSSSAGSAVRHRERGREAGATHPHSMARSDRYRIETVGIGVHPAARVSSAKG
jgi:hypothetical protein